MEPDAGGRWVERMFPEPVDHGIARPDRAVCTVRSGTDTGVDQLGEDGANPNYEAMVERFSRRFGRVSRNGVVALAYDTARAAIHGIANAAMATPEAVRDGLERSRWIPATNGGPSCDVQFGPPDHKGYKGDFLTIRELRGGGLRLDGYHRPQWPSNAAPSPA
jgi:branched-chain amino acid transport system substrate-binding protein